MLKKIKAINALVQALFFRRRRLLAVSWEITSQCNSRCAYCHIWDTPAVDEFGTEEVFAIIDELKGLGTQIIHFTGGEALLREDLGRILDYCRRSGISVSLNSNGSLVAARIDELKSLQLLGISLDGPEEVHDLLRGKGSYKNAVEALAAARNNGIRLRIMTVLSSYNLGSVEFLLAKAREFNAPVLFQPATQRLLGADKDNPSAPDVADYRRLMRELIAKKSGSQSCLIANSLSGLKFLLSWPEMKRIRCLARLISCRIESNGRVSICFRNPVQTGRIGRGMSVEEAFMKLPEVDCNLCCCASGVELNCMLSLKADAILNAWRSLHIPAFFSKIGRNTP